MPIELSINNPYKNPYYLLSLLKDDDQQEFLLRGSAINKKNPDNFKKDNIDIVTLPENGLILKNIDDDKEKIPEKEKGKKKNMD